MKLVVSVYCVPGTVLSALLIENHLFIYLFFVENYLTLFYNKGN